MYKIIYISSGIVAVSFLNRAHAMDWMICNNFDEEGNDLHMYKLIKE